MSQRFYDFNRLLAGQLRPLYTPPRVKGAHDFTHVERMVSYSPKIQGVMGHEGRRLSFDPQEYVTACWLHNLDRVPEVQELGDEATARILLAESPYDAEARERLVDVLRQHSKKDDEPGDSHLLTAVRIADKLEGFEPRNLLGCGASLPALLPYDPAHPYWRGGTTVESQLKTQLAGIFRVVEWYAMLPSDEARALVPPVCLKAQITWLRAMGIRLADYLGVRNEMEADISRALGPHYESVLRIVASVTEI